MELADILEALLFASQQPLQPSELRKIIKKAAEASEDKEVNAFKKVKLSEVENTLEALASKVEQAGKPYRLTNVAGGWQFVTRLEFSIWVKSMLGLKERPQKLSQPALETLAVIAYRQPVTRSEIEQVRGVSVDGVMNKLLERGLIEQAGRAEVVGRPMMYRTSEQFLEHFGLRGLTELPNAEELRRIPVERPEALVTVQEELATVEGEGSEGEAAEVEAEKAEDVDDELETGEGNPSIEE